MIPSSNGIDEFTLINTLVGDLPRQAEGLLYGVGDDCAVLAGDGRRDWLVSVDTAVEGVHFQSSWVAWDRIGERTLRAAASDICAMGGRPRFALVSFAVPPQMSARAIEDCFSGLRLGAQALNVLIIGGDTSQAGGECQISLTIVGDVEHGRAIYRRGARPGDMVYLTGALGGSAAGLQMLQQGKVSCEHPLVQRHLVPPDRRAAAKWLASSGCVSSMLDISDGLVADLEHIAVASRVGMDIDGIFVPVAEHVDAAASAAGLDPLTLALGSGEEYELVFTVAGPRVPAFHQLARAAERNLGHGLTRIGQVVAQPGVRVHGGQGELMTIPRKGFVHHFGGDHTTL